MQRQQGWLIDLQRPLKPNQEYEASTTSQQIETKVDRYLVKLAQRDLDEIDRLESFFGRLKTNQRRITGRKSALIIFDKGYRIHWSAL